jgi:hypothetical protein
VARTESPVEETEWPSRSRIGQLEVAVPRYFFDIKDGHRLVDTSGSYFKDDTAAIDKAKVLATGVSLDNSAVDPTRRISVLSVDRTEISTVPVYSRPAE